MRGKWFQADDVLYDEPKALSAGSQIAGLGFSGGWLVGEVSRCEASSGSGSRRGSRGSQDPTSDVGPDLWRDINALLSEEHTSLCRREGCV